MNYFTCITLHSITLMQLAELLCSKNKPLPDCEIISVEHCYFANAFWKCLVQSGDGKLVVFGSMHMFSDQYLDKEENGKILVSPLRLPPGDQLIYIYFRWTHWDFKKGHQSESVRKGTSLKYKKDTSLKMLCFLVTIYILLLVKCTFLIVITITYHYCHEEKCESEAWLVSCQMRTS